MAMKGFLFSSGNNDKRLIVFISGQWSCFFVSLIVALTLLLRKPILARSRIFCLFSYCYGRIANLSENLSSSQYPLRARVQFEGK